MRAARCSTSFMLCRFHRGINTTLSQHPAQPHQSRCTASTADYLILCLLTHLSLPANTAAKVGKGLSGDVTHPPSAILEVLHSLCTAFTSCKKKKKNQTDEQEEKQLPGYDTSQVLIQVLVQIFTINESVEIKTNRCFPPMEI